MEHEGRVGGILGGPDRTPETHRGDVVDLRKSLARSRSPPTGDPRHLGEVHEERLVKIPKAGRHELRETTLRPLELRRERAAAVEDEDEAAWRGFGHNYLYPGDGTDPVADEDLEVASVQSGDWIPSAIEHQGVHHDSGVFARSDGGSGRSGEQHRRQGTERQQFLRHG